MLSISLNNSVKSLLTLSHYIPKIKYVEQKLKLFKFTKIKSHQYNSVKKYGISFKNKKFGSW